MVCHLKSSFLLSHFSFCTSFSIVLTFSFFLVVQIKKMPHKHTCPSTSKLEQNCMATSAWVRDRVTEKLKKDSTIGAAALKRWLEEKYCIKLSYYVVWDGKEKALDDILAAGRIVLTMLFPLSRIREQVSW